MLNPQVIFNTSCSSNMVSKVYPSNHSLFIFKHLLFYCMALLKTQLPSHTHALLHPRIFVCISTISRRSRIEMDHMLHIIGVASLFCCCLFICFSSLYFVVINKVLISDKETVKSSLALFHMLFLKVLGHHIVCPKFSMTIYCS